MKRSYLPSRGLSALAAAVTIMTLTGCNGMPGRPGDDPVLRPEEVLDFNTLYKENCSGCHGAEGRGGAAVSLANPVYLAFIDDVTLRRVTAQGVTGTMMPAFAESAGGTLTDRQIDVLVEQIRGRWARVGKLGGVNPPPYAESLPGDAARGAGVFATFCSSCHGLEGKGKGKVGSIVDGSYLALVSNQGLRTTVLVGLPDEGAPDWRSDVPGRPMTGQEVSDVVAWLLSQRPQFPGEPYPSVPGPASGGSQ